MGERGEVEFFMDNAGDWRWRVKGANGEIVAVGEAHSKVSDAKRAFLRAAVLCTEALIGLTEVARDDG